MATIYPNTVAGVYEVLERSFGGVHYVHTVLDQVLRANKKWGARDRGFVAEHSYEMVRQWRKLWALDAFIRGEKPLKAEPSLKRKDIKRLFWVYWLVIRGEELPSWVEYGLELEEGARDAALAAASAWPIEWSESYAPWFVERVSAEVGQEKWEKLAVALNTPTSVILRVNTLRVSREQAFDNLLAEGIQVEMSDIADTALRVVGRPNLMKTASFLRGEFEVQDGGSQVIPNFLEARAGMKILDACSGAGGKTLQMAADAGNAAEIIAMDVEPFKLKELEKRAERAGVRCIRTAPIKTARDVQRLAEWADALLLDVPCSGTGVIRRDVDTKWKLKPEHLERTLDTQAQILRTYPDALKVGGKLVYATCSILPSENERQIERFMEEFPGKYRLIEQKTIDPFHQDSDGYFVAVLEKLKP
jgi:16S rRNA (cytosine967-C5)-methyltransferase